MPTYATAADVFIRVRGLIGDDATAFTSGTTPALADVEGWMDEAVGILHSCLRSGGITPIPQTDSFAIAKLGELEAKYAEGRVRRVVAGYGGDQDNRDGQEEIEQFFEVCEMMRQDRVGTQEGFNPGTAISSGANYVRNSFVSNLTESDWAPRHTRTQKY